MSDPGTPQTFVHRAPQTQVQAASCVAMLAGKKRQCSRKGLLKLFCVARQQVEQAILVCSSMLSDMRQYEQHTEATNRKWGKSVS